ncbi:hypothetical protein MNV49_000877 [Pseudohyphozyma bogoriensis]|nr:hypothetical protein MNV49_000877 [Pseudohyphozyma bogoriensis]
MPTPRHSNPQKEIIFLLLGDSQTEYAKYFYLLPEEYRALKLPIENPKKWAKLESSHYYQLKRCFKGSGVKVLDGAVSGYNAERCYDWLSRSLGVQSNSSLPASAVNAAVFEQLTKYDIIGVLIAVGLNDCANPMSPDKLLGVAENVAQGNQPRNDCHVSKPAFKHYLQGIAHLLLTHAPNAKLYFQSPPLIPPILPASELQNPAYAWGPRPAFEEYVEVVNDVVREYQGGVGAGRVHYVGLAEVFKEQARRLGGQEHLTRFYRVDRLHFADEGYELCSKTKFQRLYPHLFGLGAGPVMHSIGRRQARVCYGTEKGAFENEVELKRRVHGW